MVLKCYTVVIGEPVIAVPPLALLSQLIIGFLAGKNLFDELLFQNPENEINIRFLQHYYSRDNWHPIVGLTLNEKMSKREVKQH